MPQSCLTATLDFCWHVCHRKFELAICKRDKNGVEFSFQKITMDFYAARYGAIFTSVDFLILLKDKMAIKNKKGDAIASPFVFWK